MKTNQMVCHLKSLLVTHRNIIMHIIFFIYLFFIYIQRQSNIYTVVNMKRNICPIKLNYIMPRVKTLLANIIYFNNHYKQ